MRNYVLFFGFVLFVAPAFGQNNIKKSAAVTYTQGPPTYTVLLPSSSEIAVDTTTGKIYQYHRTTSTWLQLGQGIDVISGSIPPAYTPLRNQSLFAINAVDSLYHYRSGAWRHLNAGGGSATTNGHVFAGNGTPVAQKDTADFIDNDIQFSVSNTSTRTQVSGTIAADSVNSTHIQAGAVGNSELASNAVDSSKIVGGGVSVTDIGQHGAISGEVLKWNGTQWAPAADTDSDPVIAANEVAYGTGTDITSSPTVKIIPAGDPSWDQILVLKPGITSNLGGILIDSVDADGYGIVLTTVTQSGENSWRALDMEMYGTGITDIEARLDNNSTDVSADAKLTIAATAGDPSILFSTTGSTHWHQGVDNSDTDAFLIGYGASFPPSPAVKMNTSNLVGIGGAPVSGKALTVTGEMRVSDLTSDAATGFVGTDADGDLSRLKLGTGLSVSNDTVNVSGVGDDWGAQVVEVDGTTIIGDGTSGDPLSWNGAYVAGALSGNGYSGTPITILNDGITQQYIADSAVTSLQIRDTTIVAADIKDATITNAKLDAGVGGIYKGSGSIAPGAVATLQNSESFTIDYDGGNNALKIDDDFGGTVRFSSKDGNGQFYLNSGAALIQGIAQASVLGGTKDFTVDDYAFYFSADTAPVRLFLKEPGGSNITGFISGAMSSDLLYTLPTAAPSDGQVLRWTTGGLLDWETISGGATDHGALTGLADDDHTQYAMLAGRSGGQSLTGGTSSAENLTLNSTSHATKGAVLIGTDNSKTVVGASVYFRADIAPSGLSADTDDWNPAGLDTASTMRIYATDTVNLTGLQGGTDGRILYIYNIGEFPITLKTNTTSTSAYRFYFDADIELKYNQGIILQYDGSASKWRAAGSTTWARSSVSYEYTSAQTNAALTVPTGAKAVSVLCVGAGGGGGGGRRGAAGSIRSGGGGGAGGGVSFGTWSMASLINPTTLYVNLGNGGTAGTAATTDDTNGGNGGSSSDSDVRTSTASGDRFITANAGNFGTGGDNNGSNGGGAASGALFSNSAGAASSATGAAGTVSTASNFVNGGGSGGGLTTGNASSAGGNGGSSCMGMYSTLTGGTGGTSGTDGQSRTLNPTREYGQGGAGGGSGSAGIGGNGGNGIRGGGGGGGGASVNGNNSGAGGAGGPGYVKLIFYF